MRCLSVHVRAQLSKQTHETNVIYLERVTTWARVCIMFFPVSIGCYVDWNLYLTKILCSLLWPPLILLLTVRGSVWLPSRSAFPNLSSFCNIPLWEDNNHGRVTPSLPLCSLKRLPQLASFLMMRPECLLLSVLLSKQFPPVWPPPSRSVNMQPGTQALFRGKKRAPGCTFI